MQLKMNVLKAYKKDDEDSKQQKIFASVLNYTNFQIICLFFCRIGGANPFLHLEKTTVLQEVRLLRDKFILDKNL